MDDKSSLKGAWLGHVNHYFGGTNHISGTTEAIVVKFYKQVDYVKY